jgi:ferredoxin
MKVRFEPQHLTVEADPDKCILQIAQDNKVHIRSVCKGLPSCGECRVYLLEGDGNVLPPTKAELNVLGTNHFVDHRRLSCQLRCFGDVVIDVGEHVGRQDSTVKKIRGAKKGTEIERSSAVVDTLLLKESTIKKG